MRGSDLRNRRAELAMNPLVGVRIGAELVEPEQHGADDRRRGRSPGSDARSDLPQAGLDRPEEASVAGLEQSAPESLSGRMRAQTEAAIEQADAVFFMIDARAGPIPA